MWVLNYCVLSCARQDETVGSLAIVNLLLTRKALSLQKKSSKKKKCESGIEAGFC